MIKITGVSNITAKMIADSISSISNDRICTFELEYPRFIHSELMTHRAFSRNAASSRAIPISKMIEFIDDNFAEPIHWGKNQAGMQAEVELSGEELTAIKALWIDAKATACEIAALMLDTGAHKQIVNRILEPFQIIKTVVTATEFDNFFHLRCHKDAQPEIKHMADLMFAIMNSSKPELLNHGEYHTPYVEHVRNSKGILEYVSNSSSEKMNSEQAVIVSASCCAQVSYRKNDDSYDKALMIYDRLVNNRPLHASPFEHQATPMKYPIMGMEGIDEWEKGVTHMSKDFEFWSGNFRGWIQNRQTIHENVYTED